MSKTLDIELRVVDHLSRFGSQTEDQLLARSPELTGGDDPRWLMVALMHLRQRGRIRYVTCTAGHNHDCNCLIELIEPST